MRAKVAALEQKLGVVDQLKTESVDMRKTIVEQNRRLDSHEEKLGSISSKMDEGFKVKYHFVYFH